MVQLFLFIALPLFVLYLVSLARHRARFARNRAKFARYRARASSFSGKKANRSKADSDHLRETLVLDPETGEYRVKRQ